MNRFLEEYHRKVITADETIKLLKPGRRVYIEQGPAEPFALTEALMRNAASIAGITLIIVAISNINKTPFAVPPYTDYWKAYCFFGTPELWRPIAEKKVEYVPTNLSEIPTALHTVLRPDVAMIQVSPPDAAGFCNLGIAVDYNWAAIEAASTVIAQVNKKMPVTCGNTGVHLSEIDWVVEADTELAEYPSSTPGEVEKLIAAQVAALVPDGATIQVGIGGVPDAILTALLDKHELGIHSGLLSDLMLDLIEAGVVTGKQKNIDRRKVTVGVLMGTSRLYQFCDRNPLVELYPVTYTHNRALASQLDNFISINSAIEVDLTGQINCEQVNGQQIAGIGGQIDFIRIAKLSRGGKSIITMPATVKGKSKIVPQLALGTPTSTARVDVDCVVTEYGVADLRYRSLRERAMALAAIAHPDFRAELQQEAEKL